MQTPEDTVNIHSTTQSADMSVDVTIEGVMEDVVRLRALLKEETELFRRMNIDGVKQLYEEKMRLIRRLEIQQALLAKNPSIVQGLSDDDKQLIRDLNDEMHKVLRSNFHEALKAKEVNQCVIEAVSMALSTHQHRATGYDKHGRGDVAVAGPVGAKTSSSLAVNKTI